MANAGALSGTAGVPRTYWRGVWIALDRLGNALTRGDCDLTISQQAALRARQGKRAACVLCWLLSRVVEPDHCERSLTDATAPPAAKG